MKKREKGQKFLIFAGVIIPGIIISILGLYYVSQQKTSRELNLKKEYEFRINEIRQNMEVGAAQSIEKVFTELSTLDTDISDPSSILETVKSLVINNPVIRHPFILNENLEFIFPITIGKGNSHLRSPDLAVSDPATAPLYLKGRELEFTKVNIPEALRTYSECLRSSSEERSIPYILNAIARCYFKTKRYHQASYYYQLIIKDHKNEIKNDLPFWLTILRQAALSNKHLGLMQSSLKHYLTIYELIIEHESLTSSEQFEMYKNEALDHLMRYRELLRKPEFSKYSTVNLPELENITGIDRILEWRFIEGAENLPGSGEDGRGAGEERFLKLRELHTPSDEKTWFYRTIRKKVNFKSISEQTNIRSFLFFPANKYVDIGYRKLRTPSGRESYITGFLVSEDYIRQTYFPDDGEKTQWYDDLTLKIEYNKDIDQDRMAGEGPKVLINAPFKNILNGYSLVLYSNDPGHYKTIAGKEVWINYGLIISLITALILGTFFFYKYITKEMELLQYKAEFIDRVSHTLKTPITRMRLLAENITSGWIEEKDKRDEFLKSIISETEGMNETINNMLNFSQIDSGKKFYRFKKVSLKDLINDFLEKISEDISMQGSGIRTELEDGLPDITADPDGIKLILSNLIQNSCKYSPEKKNVLIKLTGEGGNIKLEVKDTGIGISTEDQKRIFEKFFRSGVDKVSALEGSGLGLFITAHAVAAHNGEISVKSTPGEGSSFIVLFPADDTMRKK